LDHGDTGYRSAQTFSVTLCIETFAADAAHTDDASIILKSEAPRRSRGFP
jgi:hypothetical protein